LEVPHQFDEISPVNEVIEVEKVSRLQDLEVNLEEVNINNLSSFEDQMDEDTEKGERKDDFDISNSE